MLVDNALSETQIPVNHERSELIYLKYTYIYIYQHVDYVNHYERHNK